MLSSTPSSPAAISQYEAAVEKKRRRRARSNLLAFTEYTKPDYETNWHHRRLCTFLDRFVSGEISRGIISMPPQHGKSELASRRLPAYLFGKNPDLRIIACSHTADLAGDMNLDVQRIMDTDEYQRLFPAIAFGAVKNTQKFTIADHRGYYKAAGVGGSITGRGFDVGIIDDPIKDFQEAYSPVQRAAIWNWYANVFRTRRGKDARIVIIMTRWHPEDLVGRLLKLAGEDPRADQWEVLRLRALREATDHDQADPRQIGEPLWPSRYPLADVEAQRAAGEHDFQAQYQQNPRAEGGVEWPESYFNGPGFWFDEWPPLNRLNIRIVAQDPSKGTDGKPGDYQATVMFGRDDQGIEYVEADLGHRPMTAPLSPDGNELGEGMVEAGVDMAIAFNAHGFGVETNLFASLLRIPFELVCKRRGKHDLPFYGINNHENKILRIRRLGAPLSQRRMRFRRTRGTMLLVDQLKQFPLGDYDDGPDALEMARRLAIEMHNKPGLRQDWKAA
jgi:hypothetical protein